MLYFKKPISSKISLNVIAFCQASKNNAADNPKSSEKEVQICFIWDRDIYILLMLMSILS